MSSAEFWKQQWDEITDTDAVFESPTLNSDQPHSFGLSGHMDFIGFTEKEIQNNFRVIPENPNDKLIIPSTKIGCYGDGFYWSNFSDQKYWFKISAGGWATIIRGKNSNLSDIEIISGENAELKALAKLLFIEYYVGWKPKSQPHHIKNPFDKE